MLKTYAVEVRRRRRIGTPHDAVQCGTHPRLVIIYLSGVLVDEVYYVGAGKKLPAIVIED